MMKKLDESITNLKMFRHATKNLKEDIQMYVQHEYLEPLVEITEIFVVCPKDENDKPYLVLRVG